jgi:hypothetical protein
MSWLVLLLAGPFAREQQHASVVNQCKEQLYTQRFGCWWIKCYVSNCFSLHMYASNQKICCIWWLQVWADTCLVFNNAKAFNPPGSDVNIMAQTLQVSWKPERSYVHAVLGLASIHAVLIACGVANTLCSVSYLKLTITLTCHAIHTWARCTDMQVGIQTMVSLVFWLRVCWGWVAIRMEIHGLFVTAILVPIRSMLRNVGKRVLPPSW